MSPIHGSRGTCLVLPLLCLGFVACSEDPTDPDPNPAPVVAEIRFAVDDSLGLYAGETGALGAVAHDTTGAVIADATIEWAVSDADVVSVDSAGEFTAVAQGLAVITATIDSISATVTVRVTEFVQIAAKYDPLCALDVEGRVWCIGTARNGRFDGVPDLLYETWREVSEDVVFSDLTSGYYHTCALAGADAFCWGDDEAGQLGSASSSFGSAVPVPVSGDHVFDYLDGGWQHTCALDSEGDAYCWGRSFEGQLGNGEYRPRPVPTAVAGEHTWRTIDAGGHITCGVADDGLTYCWGGGQAGDSAAAMPVMFPGVPADLEVIRADVGACGSKANTVYCWRWEEAIAAPAQTTMPEEVVDLVLGDGSVCALLAGGTVRCWGSNVWGLLGDPGVESTAVPIPVVSDKHFVALTGEWYLHCALADDGGVYCWGHTNRIDHPIPRSTVPRRVPAPMP